MSNPRISSGVSRSLSLSLSLSLRVCVYARARVCVCVCACACLDDEMLCIENKQKVRLQYSLGQDL